MLQCLQSKRTTAHLYYEEEESSLITDFVKKKGGNAKECTKTSQGIEKHRTAFLKGRIIFSVMFCILSMKEQT